MLSIAIVNYNNCKEIEKCLESVSATKNSLETEIFVFDNNSNDGSAHMVETKFPKVRLMKNKENVGLSRAINEILKKISGDYILFLDSDTEVKPRALQNLVDFLRKNEDVGVVGARVFNEDGSIQETARRFPNLLSGLFGRRALVTRIFPNNPISAKFMCIDNIDTTNPFEVDYVSAACMMMKKKVVSKLKFMDEDFFVYWTDVDWCKRAKDEGYKIFCIPSAKVIHYERYQPERRKNPKMIIDFHRGAYNYYSKHNASGTFSPMKLFSFVTLTVRTLFHLFLNEFKK